MDMLAQIHICEPSLPQQTDEAVIAHLRSQLICHALLLSLAAWRVKSSLRIAETSSRCKKMQRNGCASDVCANSAVCISRIESRPVLHCGERASHARCAPRERRALFGEDSPANAA